MLNKLYKFWFERQPSTALDLVRITFGLVVFLSYAYSWGQVTAFYSAEGFIPGDYVQSFFRDTRFSLLDYFQDPLTVQVLYAVFLIVIVLFTIGYKTKYMKILQFILLLSFQERNFLILNSGDTLIRVMSFYFMISPCGKSFSIDAMLSKVRNTKISIWTVRLMQFQLAVVYFFAAQAKLGKEVWMDGTAVNYIVRNSIFNRFNAEWITNIPTVVNLVTWSTLFVVVAFPFLIWFDKFRKPMLALGVMMHAGIFIFLDVGWFSLIVFALYPIFLTHEEIIAAKNWIASRFPENFHKR